MSDPMNTKVKKSPKFPIILNHEEDRIAHFNWLDDQQKALDKLHIQVLEYIQPLQAEIIKKRREWWEKIYARHKLDLATSYQLKNQLSPMPMLTKYDPPKVDES